MIRNQNKSSSTKLFYAAAKLLIETPMEEIKLVVMEEGDFEVRVEKVSLTVSRLLELSRL